MFLRVEVKKGTDEELLASKIRKWSGVADVKISKSRKKKKEKMTDYYANGKQLSVKEFKKRIAAAEKDIEEGRFITHEELKKKWEAKKKKLIG